jgi:hypothetical protein
VRGCLAWPGFGLASLICAWGAYTHGSQLIAALTFASKGEEPIPLAFGVLIGLYAVHTIGVCAGWWVGYLGMTTGRYRQAAIGLAVALVASTSLLITLFTRFGPAG